MRNKEPAPNCSEKEHTISLLAVITPKHTAELERILSHTGWQTHFVASVQEAMQTLKSLTCFCRALRGPISRWWVAGTR